MATWPANAETNWNAKMLAYLAIEHDTDGTHAIDNMYGTGVSKSKDTNYTAATSGTLVVMSTDTWVFNVDHYVLVKSDDNATPTTVVGKTGGRCLRADSAQNIVYQTMSVPIIKGKKYRVEDVGAVINSITFYPLETQ